jgi:hypothetical protein
MNYCGLWLYGSLARGDDNHLSDIDILATGNDQPAVPNNLMSDGRRVAVSRYRWAELKRMSSYGSLFLVHIRREGKWLCGDFRADSKMRTMLSGMPPYQLAARDVAQMSTALADVNESLGCDPELMYEISVLSKIARHTAILAAYILGTPAFDRLTPLYLIADSGGFRGRHLSVYEELVCGKRCPTLEFAWEASNLVKQLLRFVKRRI